MSARDAVVYLSGGVGGARLLHGMAQVLPDAALTAVINTGDDFRHWGLWICPDLDTCMYTLGGLADEARGWGLRHESFHVKSMMERYGAPSWFSLGDRDLATHLTRTEALHDGVRLTELTARLCKVNGVDCRLLPMCDAPRQTVVDTELGSLPFQRWFVEHRAALRAQAVHFEGETATTPEVLATLEAASLVIIGPSNPYVSIDPILTLEGVRERLQGKRVVALSPIVGGRAVKGPLAEMIATLAHRPASPAAIVDHYAGLLDGIVVERGDEDSAGDLPYLATDTIMGGAEDRARLAEEVLAFAESLS